MHVGVHVGLAALIVIGDRLPDAMVEDATTAYAASGSTPRTRMIAALTAANLWDPERLDPCLDAWGRTPRASGDAAMRRALAVATVLSEGALPPGWTRIRGGSLTRLRLAWLDHDKLCQHYRSQGVMPCDCHLGRAVTAPSATRIRFCWPGGGAFAIDRCCGTPVPLTGPIPPGAPDGRHSQELICVNCHRVLATLEWAETGRPADEGRPEGPQLPTPG